jgi:hypothetical protein
MSLSDLEQHVLAYWLASDAPAFSMAPRFYPYGELTLIVNDKIQVATRKFGSKVNAATKPAANAFIDALIEKGGLSSQKGKFGGTMHQYQADTYPRVVAEMAAADPIVQQAKSGGAEFWEAKFAELGG